jgi:hypothetical protein
VAERPSADGVGSTHHHEPDAVQPAPAEALEDALKGLAPDDISGPGGSLPEPERDDPLLPGE